MTDTQAAVKHLDVHLERDGFLRRLVRELAGSLQDVVGLEQASGFISVVGQTIGDHINAEYRTALQAPELTREQVAAVLVDLKRRIQGDFYIIEQDDEKILLGNRACPFGDLVKDRPALCMMTSNVFGVIAAENLGYARVHIEESIAKGDAGCRVAVYFKPAPEAADGSAQEYYRA